MPQITGAWNTVRLMKPAATDNNRESLHKTTSPSKSPSLVRVLLLERQQGHCPIDQSMRHHLNSRKTLTGMTTWKHPVLFVLMLPPALASTPLPTEYLAKGTTEDARLVWRTRSSHICLPSTSLAIPT